MHNFIETQNIEKLGYEKKWFATRVASMLERRIANNTLLFVPLESQRLNLEGLFHTKVHSILIPYVEGICSFVCKADKLSDSKSEDTRPLSFLLFGSWGPQKDLEGALRIFKELIDEGNDIRITLSGNINSNFPYYEEKIERFMAQLPSKCIMWTRDVPETMVSDMFENSDVLFLPYNAAGGYSGVMNVGAFYGMHIVSYDVSELRELDSIIHASCIFVDPSKPDEVKRTLIEVARESRRTRGSNRSITLEKIRKSLRAVEDFVDLIFDGECQSVILSAIPSDKR